jgi:AAA15 family ATPase/GTPase
VKGKEYELRFSDESDGTQKLIAALPVFLLALKEGRLVIIDELDAKLHPKLLRYIIAMFKNPVLNAKGAQLLFTSHDVTILYFAEMKFGLQQKMTIMKVKFILSMKLEGRIMKGLIVLQHMINNIWREDMEQTHI